MRDGLAGAQRRKRKSVRKKERQGGKGIERHRHRQTDRLR